jgi:hypothetical protein
MDKVLVNRETLRMCAVVMRGAYRQLTVKHDIVVGHGAELLKYPELFKIAVELDYFGEGLQNILEDKDAVH